ncbi:MAG: hypothetical protein AB7O43_19440 [Hyphomicrobiaceae bacterium]
MPRLGCLDPICARARQGDDREIRSGLIRLLREFLDLNYTGKAMIPVSLSGLGFAGDISIRCGGLQNRDASGTFSNRHRIQQSLSQKLKKHACQRRFQPTQSRFIGVAEHRLLKQCGAVVVQSTASCGQDSSRPREPKSWWSRSGAKHPLFSLRPLQSG